MTTISHLLPNNKRQKQSLWRTMIFMDKNFQRLIDLLSMLPSKSSPKISTAKLAERLATLGYSVSLRTVQRDLEDLALKYTDIECDKRSKPYTWGWVKDKVRISVPGMDPNQALSLKLLNSHLADILPESVLRDLRPLITESTRVLSESYSASAITKWSDKVAILPLTPSVVKPKIQPLVHDAVTEALLNETKLTITYVKANETEPKKKTVYPLGLVQQGVVQYLVMVFDGYLEAVYMPMHRIKKANTIAEKGKAPKGFTLKKFINQGVFGHWSEFADLKPIKLVAKFSKSAAAYLAEAPLASDQKLQDTPDGNVRLTATVPLNERLIWWLMGYGENVVVEQPNNLRDEVAERIKKAAKAYK